MPITITMPALSPTMTEGKLAKWAVKEGDQITSGMVLAEIETDKATMEVEAVDEGTLGRILIAEGTENVAVNAPIALLLEEGEDAAALKGYGAAPDAVPGPTRPAKAESVEKAAAALPESGPKPDSQPAAAPGPSGNGHAGERVFASPLARRMAAQSGLDLGALNGSGPHGRIVKSDIEAALAQGPAARRPAAPPPTAPVQAPSAPQPVAVPPGDFIEVPLTSMRKTIARRLQESKQTIPHFYLTVDVELDALLALRQQLNAKSDDYKVSVNDFIVRASAIALRKVPEANAIWAGDKILQSRTCDVAVAVALEGGLITPLVRNADQKGLAAISAEMKELATRARAGKLKPEEYQGGAFALSNLGMYGIKDFAAVINPPHGSILAVGAGEQRPVVRQGALAVATVMSCTLSCDHRVVDGALGAKWLAVFKGLVEDPLTMML